MRSLKRGANHTPTPIERTVYMQHKEDFLKKVKVGSTIAFIQNDLVLSGKVIEIRNNLLVVRTKTHSIFFVKPQDFVWLKVGSRWPTGIYNALHYKPTKK